MIFLWVFFPVTLISYYLLLATRKQEIVNLLLLFMSLLFYTFGEPKYILLLFITVAVNYFGGLLIEKAGESNWKKAALTATVVLDLGILGYFKYYTFAAETWNLLMKWEIFSIKQVALPVGISFYTFQALSYVIDLYRGKCGVQRSFYKLLLYISFFPQLIAGPIVRYQSIEAQIAQRRVDFNKFSEGTARFIAGLGKKVILANTFAETVDRIFVMDPGELGTFAAWYGIVLYGMQIYFDFSGYSDMAIGMGKMFGFDFQENFRMPYGAVSIREFWRRWHISLSEWFKEYVYIPLGGSRHGLVRTCVNLFIVFLVTGIWHGAGWNFIVWGMIHGVFIILERLVSETRQKQSQGNLKISQSFVRFLGHVYCLTVVLVAWVFFREETLTGSFAYLGSLFRITPGNVDAGELFGRKLMVLSGAGALLCGAMPEPVQKNIWTQPWFRALALPCVMAVCLILLAADSYNPFIYFRF